MGAWGRNGSVGKWQPYESQRRQIICAANAFMIIENKTIWPRGSMKMISD